MPLLKILYCLFCQLIFICSDFNRSVLHLDLACVQTELGERSECRKQLMRAHTHARTMKTQFVPTAVRFTQMVFLQLHNILIWSHEPAHVCVQSRIRFVFMRPGWHTYCFSYLSFESSFLAWAVACLYSPLLVCVKGCDKRACMLGIKVVSVLQCGLADLLLRKKWLRSKQELEPSRSVCVSVCFLFPADPSARSLLSLAWWSTFHS